MDAGPSTATTAALSAWVGAADEDSAANEDGAGALDDCAASEDETGAMLEEPGPLCGALVGPDGPTDEELDAPWLEDVVTGGPEAPPLELLTAPVEEDAASFSLVVQA